MARPPVGLFQSGREVGGPWIWWYVQKKRESKTGNPTTDRFSRSEQKEQFLSLGAQEKQSWGDLVECEGPRVAGGPVYFQLHFCLGTQLCLYHYP